MNSSLSLPLVAARAALGMLLIVLFAISPTQGFAQRFATGSFSSPAGSSPDAELLRDVRIEQHLGTELPLDCMFYDEHGQRVRLGDYFHDKPVIIALVQYRCPMLCTQVLNGYFQSSRAIPLLPARDYEFVAISFDARESPELASEKKRHYMRADRRPEAELGVHFLTGSSQSIAAVTEAVGFHYRYVPRSDQFAHASGVMIATPQGRLSRYLYGIEYPPQDLRLGLIASSEGKVGSFADQVLLLCYHYDPLTGRYGLAIARLLTVAGVCTVITLGAFLFVAIRHERIRPKLLRQTIGATDLNRMTTLPVKMLEQQ